MKKKNRILMYQVLILVGLVSSCEKKVLPPMIEASAYPLSIAFLGSSTIGWRCEGATECLLAGKSVPLDSSFILSNLNADTTLVFSCSGPSGSASKSLTIQVEKKSLYMIYIDTLTTGWWYQTEIRAEGIEGLGPEEWDIMITPPGDSNRTVFYQDSSYRYLTYTHFLGNTPQSVPFNYLLTPDCKKLYSGTSKEPTILSRIYQIMTLTNDSLILFCDEIGWGWAGSNGSGSGHFPTIFKYKHCFN